VNRLPPAASSPKSLRLERHIHASQIMPMIGRLFRPLLAVLVAFALVGMPVAGQAIMPPSCGCMHGVSATPQPCSDHSSTPCKGIAATCAGAMSCVSITGLPEQEMSTATWLALSPVAYSIGDFNFYRRSTKPILGPPITI
jgi:hypothetical protein